MTESKEKYNKWEAVNQSIDDQAKLVDSKLTPMTQEKSKENCHDISCDPTCVTCHCNACTYLSSSEKSKEKLKPFNPVIQVCPKCHKVDVAEGHEKDCDPGRELRRQENEEYYD